MATTTNYSWSTPDDTALVKDGAAAIRSLGTAIDTTTKALNPSTTLGDIEYRSSTANTNTRLAIGTTGQVLTVAGGVPSWATPAGGGGKVLQVVHASYSTAQASSSTTYADTGLTATITPSSATSKILVLVSQNGLQKTNAESTSRISIKLLRDSTTITTMTLKSLMTNTALELWGESVSTSWLDSPATTSAITYKTQFRSDSGTAYVLVQSDGTSASTITLLEIGA